jgi:hypothetical protein
MLTFAIILTISQIIAVYLMFSHEAKQNSQLEHHNDLLALRLKALKQETELLQEDLQAARVLRHDLRHHYRLLYALLGEGDYSAATEHIGKQKEEILTRGKEKN